MGPPIGQGERASVPLRTFSVGLNSPGSQRSERSEQQMLEELNDLPAGVIGFEAVGTIHSDDYDAVLRPAVEATAAQGGIRMVYVFGDRFEGYSSGATWEDAKLGLGNARSWERTAIVSDHEWAEHLVKPESLTQARPVPASASNAAKPA